MKKLILLDRDGVINQDSWHYIKSVQEFILIPGSTKAISRLNRAGYIVGVATNQSGIARKYYTEQDLDAIHEKMFQEVNKAGGNIAAVEFCPHLPEEHCACRKPEPGMLLKLGERLNYDLINVPFIGDRITDIQAALAVGAKPYVILSPMTDMEALAAYPHVPLFASLAECVDFLLK